MPPRADFENNPAAFFQQYATIMPAAQADAGSLATHVAGDFCQIPGYLGGFNIGYTLPSTIADAKNVAWHDRGNGEMELVIDGSYRAGVLNLPATEFFPAFFLPWRGGNVARMDLPNSNMVRYFFTAEMNGCAFLVAGHRDRPSVAHLNVSEPMPVPPAWPTARQQLLETMMASTLVGKNQSRPTILTKWGPQAGLAAAAGFARATINAGPTYTASPTEQAAALAGFDTSLLNINRKVDPATAAQTVVDIRCSTMGRRHNGRWHFSYQRSLYVLSTQTIRKLNNDLLQSAAKDLLGDQRKRTAQDRRFIIPGSEFVHLWP